MEAINYKGQIYRGYQIQKSEWFPGKFEYFQEGEVTSRADSIEEAKRLIDEEVYMSTNYPVKIGSRVYYPEFLTEAMELIKTCGAVPMFSFNAP